MSWWRRLVQGEFRENSLPIWKRVAPRDYARTIMSWRVTNDFHAKQGRSTGRLVLRPPPDDEDSPTLVVYLKRHEQLRWWQRIMATLWPGGNWSDASEEWEHLQWAQSQGILVPEPLAVGEFIGPWFGLQSYLVITELTGMLPLHQAIPRARQTMQAEAFRHWKQLLIAEMARIARLLHHQHRYHRDLYLCHFYVPQPHARDMAPGPLHLIDLHRLGHHPWVPRRWQVKDLAQLLFSTWGVPGIDDHDRFQFLRAYFGSSSRTGTQVRLLRSVIKKAKRYARHNAIDLPVAPMRRKAA